MSQAQNFDERPWLDPDAEPFIKIQSVSKHFGDFTAVDSVDLEVFQGGGLRQRNDGRRPDID